MAGGLYKGFWAIIRPDGEWFHLFCPDLPGFHIQGSTPDETVAESRALISEFVADEMQSGVVHPPISPQPNTAAGDGEVAVFLPIAAAVRAALQLRRARRIAGVTQAEVASRMRVTENVYRRLEGGEGNPTLATLERAATALGSHFNIDVDRDEVA